VWDVGREGGAPNLNVLRKLAGFLPCEIP